MSDPRTPAFESTTSTRIIVRNARALYDLGLASTDAETEHETWSDLIDDTQPGQLVGRYRIIRKLGEGGFGAVWQAEQMGLSKMVAVKLIKPGMDSRQVISRFETERQTLAMMSHPNIAAVLDAGTTTLGHPYFVMELVHGISITKFSDGHRFSLRERLRIFQHVCQAVHHAHQKAVLHRDIKPSNILVEQIDGEPVPKIIDFGIAKALATAVRPGADTTSFFTGVGAFLGTPPYMSPEQAGARLDVDTRSDIYSLGAVLYEMLTGRTHIPLDYFRGADVAKMVNAILETEPVRPSLLFVQPANHELTVEWAAARSTDPQTLAQNLRGDLDWIVLKALEKDRNRRYESAAALADDIQRYLSDEPVIARPPSRIYVLSKLVRRNRAAFIAAALTTIALIAGITAATVGMVKAGQALRKSLDSEQLARSESEKTQQVLSFMSGLFVDSKLDPDAFRELIQTTNAKRLREMEKQPEADMRVSRILANGYRELNELREAEALNLHALERLQELGRDHSTQAADCLFDIVWIRNRLVEESAPFPPSTEDELLLRTCVDIRRNDKPPQAEALIQAEVLTAALHRRLGRMDRARETLESLTTGTSERSVQSSASFGWVLREQALVALAEGRHEDAVSLLQKARSSLMHAAASTKAQLQTQADISRILSSVHLASGNLAAAEEEAQNESTRRQEWLGHGDPGARIRLARVLARQNRRDEAEAALNDAVKFCAQSVRWTDDKEAALRLLVEIGKQSRPANDPALLTGVANLVRLLLQEADDETIRHHPDPARRLLVEADTVLKLHIVAPAPWPAEMAGLFIVRASLAARQKDYRTAVADLDQAVKLVPGDLQTRFTLAILLLESGQTERFEQERLGLVRLLDEQPAISGPMPGGSFDRLIWIWRAALIRPGLSPQDIKRVNDSLARATYGRDERQNDEWQALLRGIADYRSGQYQDAASWFNEAANSSDKVIAAQYQFFVAMNQLRLSPADAQVPFIEGQTGFDEAFKPFEGTDTTLPLRDYLTVKLVKDEAGTLFASYNSSGTKEPGSR